MGFCNFQKGGILDPNKDLEEAAQKRADELKKQKEERLKKRKAKPLTADDFKDKRVSKLGADEANGLAGSTLSALKKSKKQKGDEAEMQARRNHLGTSFSSFISGDLHVDSSAPLAQRIQDVLTQATEREVKPIYLACSSGQVDVCEYFIAQGENIDATNETDLSTPLHGACNSGHLHVVKYLLEAKADLNSKTSTGANALHMSCQSAHFEIIQLLLSRGVNIDQATTSGITPLMFSSRIGDQRTCQLLLDNNADLFAIFDGLTAHDWAAAEGHVSVASLLQLRMRLKKVEDMVEATGAPALYLAAEKGHLDLVEEIVSTQPDVKLDSMHNGRTPLFVACELGFTELADFLLEHQADPNLACEGVSPLCAAVRKSFVGPIETLVRHGATVDGPHDGESLFDAVAAMHEKAKEAFILGGTPEADAFAGPAATFQYFQLLKAKNELAPEFVETLTACILDAARTDTPPLVTAVEKGQDDVFEWMLANGAFVDGGDAEGTTALLVACNEGKQELVKALTEQGALVNACNVDGSTPLHMSCQRNFPEITRMLLEHGAAPNVLFQEGITPLMMAARYGGLEAAQVLCEFGADPTLRFEGRIALEYAIEDQQEAVAAFLRTATMSYVCENDKADELRYLVFLGCAVTEPLDENEATPLHLAATMGNTETCKTLIELGADVNATQRSGASPLHFACQKGHPDVVRLLVTSKADIDMASFKGGITPLMMAARFGQLEAAQMLAWAGARLEIDFDGKRAVDWAEEQGQTEVAEFLKFMEQDNLANGAAPKPVIEID